MVIGGPRDSARDAPRAARSREIFANRKARFCLEPSGEVLGCVGRGGLGEVTQHPLEIVEARHSGNHAPPAAWCGSRQRARAVAKVCEDVNVEASSCAFAAFAHLKLPAMRPDERSRDGGFPTGGGRRVV